MLSGIANPNILRYGLTTVDRNLFNFYKLAPISNVM